jgi:hypothetical protein
LALRAVHVPIVGYEWRQHPAQDTRNDAFADAYARAIPALRDVTCGWMGAFDGQIPQIGAAA